MLFLLLSVQYLVIRLLGRRYAGDFGYIAGEWVANMKSGCHPPNTGESEGLYWSCTLHVVLCITRAYADFKYLRTYVPHAHNA